jgi:hypothetical protein
MRHVPTHARSAAAALGALTLAIFAAGCSGGSGSVPGPATGVATTGGQTPGGSTAPLGPETFASFAVSSADQAAAQSATALTRHAFPIAPKVAALESSIHARSPAARPEDVAYPEDLAYGGGSLVTNAVTHNVYLSVGTANASPATWGDPHKFLSDLFASTYLGVVDQYVGSGTYAVGESALVTSTNFSYGPLYDNDLLAIIHSVASQMNPPGDNGYNVIYNLFLPPGVDTCYSYTAECYSPDHLSTFAFCAYHSSVTFTDIGHVLYTIQPYQPATVVEGGNTYESCSILSPQTDPNFLEDATDSSLEHETFETISDPDPPSGWTVPYSNGGVAGGNEMADLCDYSSLESVLLNGTLYKIQPMYSNKVHACVNSYP